MVLPVEVIREIHDGNDVTTVFSFDFTINKSADLRVIITDNLDNETEIFEGTGTSNYSLSVASYPGDGSITYPATLGTPLPTGYSITLFRDVDIEQQTDLKNQGRYSPETVETAIDYSRMVDQQQQDEINRSVKASVTDSSGANYTLPPPEANKVIGYDASGLALQNKDLTSANTFAFVNRLIKAFAGDGIETQFTLDTDPAQDGNVDVFIDGVHQKATKYTRSGAVLTFTTAPPGDGVTENIEVRSGETAATAAVADGAITTAKLAALAVTDAKVNDVGWSKITGTPTTLGSYGITDAASDAELAAHASATNTHGVSVAIVGTTDAQALTNKTITDATNNVAWAVLSGTPTTLGGYGITDAQPLDSDLTAIAALSTTAFGRSLLALVDAAAGRSAFGFVNPILDRTAPGDIGGTTPAAISGTTGTFSGNVQANAASGVRYVGGTSGIYHGSVFFNDGYGGVGIEYDSAGKFGIGTSTAIGATGYSEKFVLDSSGNATFNGNVGISRAPTTTLDVNGSVWLNGVTVIGRNPGTYDSAGYEVLVDSNAGTGPLGVRIGGIDQWGTDSNGDTTFSGGGVEVGGSFTTAGANTIGIDQAGSTSRFRSFGGVGTYGAVQFTQAQSGGASEVSWLTVDAATHKPTFYYDVNLNAGVGFNAAGALVQCTSVTDSNNHGFRTGYFGTSEYAQYSSAVSGGAYIAHYAAATSWSVIFDGDADRVNLGTNGGVQAQVADVASANRYLILKGSNSGKPQITTNAGGMRLAPASGNIDLVDSSNGNVRIFNNETDVTAKYMNLTMPQYAVANGQFLAYGASVGASANEVHIGGGYSGYDAATNIKFHVASAVNTNLGTEVMSINDEGLYIQGYALSTAAAASSTGVLDFDLTADRDFTTVLTENITNVTVSNCPSGKLVKWSWQVTQHASAAKTITYPAGVKWEGGTDHVMSAGLSAVDEIAFWTRDGGTTIYAAIVGQAFS